MTEKTHRSQKGMVFLKNSILKVIVAKVVATTGDNKDDENGTIPVSLYNLYVYAKLYAA